MKKKDITVIKDDYIECFGEFNSMEKICRKYCALSIRCAVEKAQESRSGLIEDILLADNIPMRMQ